MANDCSTSYRFFGSKKQIENLYSFLKTISDLDDMAGQLKMFVRQGGIFDIESDIFRCEEWYAINVQTVTDWYPERFLIEELAKHFGVWYYYMAEEFGTDLFETNDIMGDFYPELYWANNENNNESEYFESVLDLLDWINEQTGENYLTYQEALLDLRCKHTLQIVECKIKEEFGNFNLD